MTAIRVERAPASSLLARPESGSWRSLDIQLTFYALALAIIGLLMFALTFVAAAVYV